MLGWEVCFTGHLYIIFPRSLFKGLLHHNDRHCEGFLGPAAVLSDIYVLTNSSNYKLHVLLKDGYSGLNHVPPKFMSTWNPRM